MTREGVMRLNCLKCDGPLTAMRAEPWGWVTASPQTACSARAESERA